MVPDLEIWSTSLQIISQANNLQLIANDYLDQLVSPEPSNHSAIRPSSPSFSQLLSDLFAQSTQLLTKLNSPFSLVSKLPKSHSRPEADQPLAEAISTIQSLQAASQLIDQLLSQDLSLLILFQNTQELRATGGFMGSFAIIKLNNGQIVELNFYDIYDADGQFKGYFSAPAGVAQYLSENKGLRLPDANWHPDFPMSANTILQILAESGFTELEGVVAINSNLVEKLLLVIGDIYLPDLGITVTTDNFATVARADRSLYFPGSKAKKNFLSQLFTQMKLKLSNLNHDQQLKLFSSLIAATKTKDIQVYFANQNLQQLAAQLNLTGELNNFSPQSLVLNPQQNSIIPQQLVYLVESNVGINKVNANVEREVFLNLSEQTTNITINFSNNISQSPISQAAQSFSPSIIPSSDSDYINYQRIITNSQFTMHNTHLNGQSVTQIDEEIIINSHGDKFKQFGFLVPVPAGEQATLTFQLLSPHILPSTFHILKQPGLPPTNYTINTGKQTKSLILEKDELITF